VENPVPVAFQPSKILALLQPHSKWSIWIELNKNFYAGIICTPAAHKLLDHQNFHPTVYLCSPPTENLKYGLPPVTFHLMRRAIELGVPVKLYYPACDKDQSMYLLFAIGYCFTCSKHAKWRKTLTFHPYTVTTVLFVVCRGWCDVKANSIIWQTLYRNFLIGFVPLIPVPDVKMLQLEEEWLRKICIRNSIFAPLSAQGLALFKRNNM